MLIQTIEHSPRPFLKWAGGKTKLIKQYIPYFPKKFKTYYEPFLGGAAVFFHLQPENAVITDINSELINVYRCVRDSLAELILLLEKHQHNHSQEYYYQVRSTKKINELERAARIIYLNKTCFNGLYRENSKGEFNVPIGRYKKPNICDLAAIHSASVALQSTLIEVRAFEDVLNYAKACDDFVYFDPPYYPLSPTSNFTAYSSYAFNEYDQIRLRNTFVELAERGVKVMLSNSDCSFIRELYKQFKIYEITASRSINSNAKKRGTITEVIVTSY